MTKQANIFYRLLLVLVVLTSAIWPCRAADDEYMIIRVGSQPLVISLVDNPIITYTGNQLHIKTTSTIDVPVSDITSIFFARQMRQGDVNGDWRVSIADLTMIISQIMANDPTVQTNNAADANDDGTVNMDDVPSIVNIILGKDKKE